MKLMISSIVMCSSVALKCFWSLKVAHARMVHQFRGAGCYVPALRTLLPSLRRETSSPR